MTYTRQEIFVVSGLPRSGTSLMMQMLERGGIEPLTDETRRADADNPKGYYELERVKKLKDDASWLPSARGKAVKMISQLLYDLPATESYRVIFMRRDLAEIIASQEKMLVRRGAVVPERRAIQRAFTRHLENLFAWLPTHPTMQVLEIDYNVLLTEPHQPAAQIAQFLTAPLAADRMLAAIDPTLYRNRDAVREE